jgi:DNA-binding MarR family transcriptional regulator
MNDLAGYLEQITGHAPVVRGLAVTDTQKVPLFLRSAYELHETRLFDRRFVLAVEQAEPEHASPAEYARHASMLRQALGADVVLVLFHVPTFVRNRLVQQGVPFIVPGRQMFLPLLVVDLRERGIRRTRTREVVSAAAQLVLLAHLQKHNVEGHSLRELAAALGYSPMTLTNVGDELQSLGVCNVAVKGRTRHLVFTTARRDLWEQALPHLDSPVRTRRWVRWIGVTEAAKIAAGMTALERTTHLNDDAIPTVALGQHEYRVRVQRGELVECALREDAEAQVECWGYDPRKLADGNCVDRLSLFLSQRDSTDERVQKELKTLLGGVAHWPRQDEVVDGQIKRQ